MPRHGLPSLLQPEPLTPTPTFSHLLTSLKRATLTPPNRLRSITLDASFVLSVASAYDLPLIANLRAGAWYVPPAHSAGSAYFKSTDGHAGRWGFSLRRLNLHVLGIVGGCDGCVIVDSTRRGKRMPDALSKTVPIWCAVLNRVLFPDRPEAHELHTPPQVISPSEHAQIEARLDDFVQQFLDLHLDIASLRAQISKPLRPLWTTPESPLPPEAPRYPAFHPVVLCTASRRVLGAEMSEGGYIQGAADDSESWARGLTPELFWAHQTALMAASEEALPSLIDALAAQAGHPVSSSSPLTPIPSCPNLRIGSLDALKSTPLAPTTLLIACSPHPDGALQLQLKTRYLHLRCSAASKPGSKDLRTALPHLTPFLDAHAPLADKAIVLCCPTGRDLAVGAALAVLCLYTDGEGRMTARRERRGIDKGYVRRKLGWLVTGVVEASPSRATLNAVNSVLMARGV